MAICHNNQRDAQTLYDLILEHVELTIIIQQLHGGATMAY
jgi:hypothetical protein